MSMLLMARAMNTKVGNSLRKLILLKLADNADDAGLCRPSYQHVADQCEMDRSTVIRHVKALEDEGYLVRRKRGRDGLQVSNEFCLNLDRLASLGGSGTAPPRGGRAPLGSGSVPLGGSGTAPPGTSHSFEPVREPAAARAYTREGREIRQALMALQRDDGTAMWRLEKFASPKVVQMIAAWVADGVTAEDVHAVMALLRMRGVEPGSPSYLDGPMRDYLREKLGGLDEHRRQDAKGKRVGGFDHEDTSWIDGGQPGDGGTGESDFPAAGGAEYRVEAGGGGRPERLPGGVQAPVAGGAASRRRH